jgi:RND family efflux transporter MFP subunit
MNTRKPWIAVALIALALTGCASSDTPDDAAVSAVVTTVPLKQGTMPQTLTAYGTVEPAADAVQVISVQVAGRVARWNVTAGMPVKRGQALLAFALSPASVAAYQQAESALKLAQAQRAHTAQLLSSQLATRDQLDQADKALRDAQSNLDALVQQQGQAATMDVTAPFDGTVASLDAKQGESLQPGAALLTLQRADGLVATVGVERDAVDHVKGGAIAALFPIDGGSLTHGAVRRIGKTIDPHTHQLSVDIVPDDALIDGEAIRAEIVVGQWKGWLLPRDAVMGDDRDRYVFQTAKGKAMRVALHVLGESGDTIVAEGALDANLPLVTTGASQLDDGMAVRVAEPVKP